jgi:hypothetical protein
MFKGVAMPCRVQKNGVESDEQLRQRFQKEILPKIQEQLKGLDQNEQPNNATIELKRQLRVRTVSAPVVTFWKRWCTRAPVPSAKSVTAAAGQSLTTLGLE